MDGSLLGSTHGRVNVTVGSCLQKLIRGGQTVFGGVLSIRRFRVGTVTSRSGRLLHLFVSCLPFRAGGKMQDFKDVHSTSGIVYCAEGLRSFERMHHVTKTRK